MIYVIVITIILGVLWIRYVIKDYNNSRSCKECEEKARLIRKKFYEDREKWLETHPWQREWIEPKINAETIIDKETQACIDELNQILAEEETEEDTM